MNWIDKKIEKYEKRFPTTDSEIKSYGEFCAVRDFLRTALQEAQQQERDRIVEWIQTQWRGRLEIPTRYVVEIINHLTK